MKNIALLLLIGLLTACGASDNSKSAQLPTELQDLKGSWQEPCEIDPDDNESNKGIETHLASGTSVEVTYYTDSDCSIEESALKITASLNYVGEKILSSGQTVKKVGIITDTDNILLLLIDKDLQNYYKNTNTCARTDWDSGEYINISNCYDFRDLVEGLKEPYQDIYEVDGNQLYWGNIESIKDEFGFPTELDTVPSTKI